MGHPVRVDEGGGVRAASAGRCPGWRETGMRGGWSVAAVTPASGC
jgi:hypothetical protein